MLDIISDNPYRVLGVYSNSPMRERVANLSKINAFLKVGKTVSFPTDMPSLLPEIDRTNEMVADANSKLALPADQFSYAQFWFVRVTNFDEIALNNLIAGDIDKAISIWEKREDVSSLQNRIICNLILDNVSDAIACAEKLYISHRIDFIKAILGENPPIDIKNVEYDFLDKMCEEIGVNEILPYVSNDEWKHYISGQAVKPLVDGLMNDVSVAKQSKGNDPEARYNAGTKLMTDTKKPLAELEKLTGKSDLQYQMTADKVGLEILQCGIDYYNHTKAYDAPKNAMVLMAYALSIVVGQMAKERCEENISIVQEAIVDLPPEIIKDATEAIERELEEFYKSPNSISSSATLLENTKPHLRSIRRKLGKKDAYYLKLSTKVVVNAMCAVINEVNSSNVTTFNVSTIESNNKIFIQALQKAWNLFYEMSNFDVTLEFKVKYNENRAILKKMCQSEGIISPPIINSAWDVLPYIIGISVAIITIVILCLIL